MDTAAVKTIRDLFHSVSVTQYDVEKTTGKILNTYTNRKPCLYVFLDNDQAIDERNHALLWCDAKEMLFYIHTPINAKMTQGTEMMMGVGEVKASAMISGVDYGEIQAIRIFCTKDIANQVIDKLVALGAVTSDGAITDKQRANIIENFFTIADSDHVTRAQIPEPTTDFSKTFDWSKHGLIKPE
jgi:hypothetical protein